MCITSSDTSQLENQLSTCSYNSEETSSFNAGRKNRTALHSSNHIGGASFRRSVKKLCEIPVPTLTLDSGIGSYRQFFPGQQGVSFAWLNVFLLIAKKICTQRQLSSNVCKKMLHFHIFRKAQTDPHKNDTQLSIIFCPNLFSHKCFIMDLRFRRSK